MARPNCSLEALLSSDGPVYQGAGCPRAAVLCGMNVSWVLADATAQDLQELCLSEEAYLARHLGPPRSPAFLPVCAAYLAIFAVGVLGNSLTCVVILRYRVMQTATNYYLLSLAASDLLVLLVGMPLELYEMWRNYPFPLGAGGCRFRTFLFEAVCFASVLNVTALSAERYAAVVHPLRVRRVATRAHARRVVAALWAASMLCAVPNASLHGVALLPPKFGRRFPRSAICHLVGPAWIYSVIILASTLVFFLLPMLIMSVLYLLIGLQLRRDRALAVLDRGGASGSGGLSQSNTHRLTKRNVQVTKMLCVLVAVFGLCWAPFHADRLMWSYMDAASEQHLRAFERVHVVSGVCFYLSSTINPILYNVMSTRFREMFCRVTCYSNGWPKAASVQMTQRSNLTPSPLNGKVLSPRIRRPAAT
ncbi:neuromedin-U receptor 1-like [Betta splendens]|uniref:Neuromedin-U receptor 1-like n=1 Tax=Betta splendens TaxID=158456 RepID=A0A9W2XD83_BETSP|nr:neuromedin-U receptor 1-like [Betta splendens]